MRGVDRRQSMFVDALALTLSLSLVAPIRAQDTLLPSGTGDAHALAENQAAQAAQRAATAEAILAAKEQSRGESFDASIRASLKRRMQTLSIEQLAGMAQLGADADLPSALGSLTSDLVYTPVTPCRVFDSRVSAGGPGPIAANTQRNVFVAGTLNFPAQGGVAGGCGVPVGATSAIVNFVTVLPAGPGNIRAWAVASPQPAAPLAAVMNYGVVAGLPAIANGVAVPLCNPAATLCSLGDLRLQADTSGTDILGDVVGYFAAAVGTPTVVRRSTNVVTANNNNGSATVNCNAGEHATGGGVLFVGGTFSNVWYTSTGPVPNTAGSTPTGWTSSWFNQSGSTNTFSVYVICATP